MTQEEIKELKEHYMPIIKLAVTKTKEYYEAQLKAKDEEIERLKAQLSSVHNLMYRNGYSDAIDCYDTFGKFNTKHKPNAKSRSIVAMLFWEWRKYNSNFKNEENSFIQGRASKTKELFYKAHKMLKEKQ